MKTESFEHIKNRMVKKAASIWGVPANEIETSFDPIITLLISACASEILKIQAELNESQNRVTEKLVQLMTPETTTGSKPAHAILHANTLDNKVNIKAEYQFYFKKRTTNKKGSQNLKNIFFSPVQDFNLINANVTYMASGKSCFSLDGKKQKTELLKNSSQVELQPSTVYLGIETNLENLQLHDVSFYFELDDIDNTELFYHYLRQAKWSINNNEIKTEAGFYNSNKLDEINIKTVFDDASNNSQNLTNQVLYFYKKHFVTITDKKSYSRTSICEDLKSFIEINQLDIPENITWIKIEFPRVINNSVLQKLYSSLNAFPVLNRELNSFTYQVKNFINILPVTTEDYFLDVKTIVNTNGEIYLPKLKDVLNSGKGNYTIRGNHVGKLDQRSAKEYLIHLIELLKDESASFSFLNNDFLHGNLKNLNQLISLLEKKVTSIQDNLTENNYITIEPYSRNESLLVDYWTTNGDEANNIKSGNDLEVYKAVGIKQKGNYLLTTTFDGKNNLNMEERLNSYRRSLLSRDRIVTKEDIKALCYELYNKKIEAVEIKKDYMNSIELNKGITQCIKILLYPNKNIIFDQDEWDSINSNLLLLLEKKSVNIFPYQIKIVK